jgi:Rrf2 family protein
MELTRQADYALRCVLETARHERISARELAERQHLSPSFVGKIVSALARAGILETRRGAAGGVRLGRPPSSISVLEVIEATQGPLRVNRCVRTPPACSLVEACPVAPVIREAQDALSSALAVSFAELLARDSGPRERDEGAHETAPIGVPGVADVAVERGGSAVDAPRARPGSVSREMRERPLVAAGGPDRGDVSVP